jgi:hypothetical protein
LLAGLRIALDAIRSPPSYGCRKRQLRPSRCRSATTGCAAARAGGLPGGRWHQPRTAAWLRDLLITCQILPDVDRALLDIEAWLDERLEALAGHPHRRRLRPYALWQLLHRYLHDTDTPTVTRAALCLLLLFAQPLSRILRLTRRRHHPRRSRRHAASTR